MCFICKLKKSLYPDLYEKLKSFYNEAYNHSRNKNLLLYIVLKGICIDDYKNKNFEEIFSKIYKICQNVGNLGILTVYDITARLCNHYNINIDKVYIIGDGPKKAIKLLNIKSKKKHKINKINLDYVDVVDVKDAFKKNNYILDEDIKNSNNGDILESYLCNWQKIH